MTTQIADRFIFNDDEFNIIEQSDTIPFEPPMLGLSPVLASTALHRGYCVVYALAESHLIVKDLYIATADAENWRKQIPGPVVEGVTPAATTFFGTNNFYAGLTYPIQFTGGILIAQTYLDGSRMRRMQPAAWQFETIYELIFEDGVLVEQANRTEPIGLVREIYLNCYKESRRLNTAEVAQLREIATNHFQLPYSF